MTDIDALISRDPLAYLLDVAGMPLDAVNRLTEKGGAMTLENLAAVVKDRLDRGETLLFDDAGNAIEAAAAVKPADFSDAGNAAVFVRQNKGRLIFTDALGWLCWNGKVWERSEHKALGLAVALSEDMLSDALNAHRAAQYALAEAKANEAAGTGTARETDQAKAAVSETKAYLAHAKQTRGAVRLHNILDLARPGLVIKTDKLDADPAALNTPAGIVDLTTGKIKPHSAGEYCTQITAASPSSQGRDLWDNFLNTITEGNNEITDFLQIVAGMALHGKVYHEGLVLAYGAGRNGKSTFFNALGAALGSYAGNIDIDALTTDRQNRGAAMATLRGKRLVTAGELEEGRRLSISTVKRICSTDRITVEEKYKQPETITPTHTLCLFTNHLPRVGSTDPGTWRRLIVTEFKATIPERESVGNFGDTLAVKAGGAILAWAIDGAVRFAAGGYKLPIPSSVAKTTQEYRQREDWLSNFIADYCEVSADHRVLSSQLYRAYKYWADDAGDYIRRLPDFNAAMEAAGYKKIAPKNRATWIGIRLRPDY